MVEDAQYTCNQCCRPDDVERMIWCENIDHPWYHLSCVGLSIASEDREDWQCPVCIASTSIQFEKRKRSRNRPLSTTSFLTSQKSKNLRLRASNKRKWMAQEENLVIGLMRDVLQEQICHPTEAKWNMISARQLERHNVDRSPDSVKNRWSRHLRFQSEIDERQTPKPDKMVTSHNISKQREAARKREAGKDSIENDEESSPVSSGRRRKCTISSRSKTGLNMKLSLVQRRQRRCCKQLSLEDETLGGFISLHRHIVYDGL